MVDDIELYMKGDTMEEDIRIETAVGTLQEDMMIHKDIEIGNDIMNDYLITVTDRIEESCLNITIANALDTANHRCTALLATDRYHLNDIANPLALGIERLRLSHHHDSPALQVHNQRT